MKKILQRFGVISGSAVIFEIFIDGHNQAINYERW